MAATDSTSAARSPVEAGAAVDLMDSNVSSPLSEVGDGDANDEEIEHLRLDSRNDAGDNSSVSGDEAPHDHKGATDSDSFLSDAASDLNSDANDTEAETERLYDTPKNQRQRDVVVDRYNNGQIFENTPSKLRRTSRMGDGDNESDSGDGESVASSRVEGAESPAKPATTNDTSVDEDVKHDSQERKRKRPPAVDIPDLDQPLRKRTSSLGPPEPDAGDVTPLNGDDTMVANLPSGVPSAAEDEPDSPSNRDEAAEALEQEEKETKTSKRSSLTRKRASSDDAAGEADSDARSEQLDAAAEDDAEPAEGELEGDAEEEAEAAARNIEEMERKNAALKDWSHIEEMFGVFRERLYRDRLQQLEEEERSLLADEPTHFDYLNMKKCIDDRLNRRLQEIETEYELQLKANERRTIAQRAQIWSQFFQAVRERREQALEKLNQQWYEVQSARRKAHSLPDYGLLFPKTPAERVRNAVAYNTEVSTLAGLAKYEGFPAGPELMGASTAEAEADFNSIAVRRSRQKHTPYHSAPREEYHAAPTFRLGPAGEQFIKDTPWANPHHSSHKLHQHQPASVQPDGRVEQAGVAGAVQAAIAPELGDVGAALDDAASAHGPPSSLTRSSNSPEKARNMNLMERVGGSPAPGH
ncbi:hypothetical protein RJ55_05666 [Drechmeria coniospora]|nr:hypothetical protein RJ55_05666 [Drechmeria coniospora]